MWGEGKEGIRIMQLEIDTEEVQRPLSRREKVGIWILLLIFRIVMPCKYTHQIDAVVKAIEEKLEK